MIISIIQTTILAFVLLLSAVSLAETSLYLTLTSEQGTSTIVVVDGRGVAKLSQLDSGVYTVSLSVTSKKFTRKSYPKSILIEWLSIDDVNRKVNLIENQKVYFTYDAEGVIQSKPIAQKFFCRKKGDYSVLCRSQIPAIYLKK